MATDTLYGILGSAFSKDAVSRIFDVKGRNEKKPLIVLISKVSDFERFGIDKFPQELRSLWPAKVTVILPCKAAKFKYLHRGSNSIAFRVPDNKALIRLIDKTGPLVAPSANPEGMIPAKGIKLAKKYFGDKIDLYVPGMNKVGKPSTILKWQKGKWEEVREGAIPFKKIRDILEI